MQTAFLIIISLLGMGYAFLTKQLKVAAGFLIITVAFALTIPDIVSGFWIDILLALSLMIFTIGVFIIVYKKKENKIVDKLPDETPEVKPLETPKEKNKTKFF